MELQRMDATKYAEHWSVESGRFDGQGVYKKLSEITPEGKVLEVGAGTGMSTLALAAEHEVLALDSNELLIKQARERIESAGANATIVATDFLALSDAAVSRIEEFEPKVVAAWFIGSNVDDQEKYVTEEADPFVRPRLYRERVERALVVSPLCQPSVDWIHMVSRGGKPANMSLEEFTSRLIDSENRAVFSPNGFEIVDVQLFDWDQSRSNFFYVNTKSETFGGDEPQMKIISIVAKRK